MWQKLAPSTIGVWQIGHFFMACILAGVLCDAVFVELVSDEEICDISIPRGELGGQLFVGVSWGRIC